MVTAAHGQDFFIGGDWDSTSFRMRLIERGTHRVIAEHASSDGIKAFAALAVAARASRMGQLLADRIADWPAAPIVVTGLASANVGWRESPYVRVPFPLDGSSAGTARVELPGSENAGRTVLLVSGVSTADDVMRGEECALIGASIVHPVLAESSAWCLLAGTHPKHAHVADGQLASFTTFLTGELFEVVARNSLLAGSVVLTALEAEPQWEDFRAGVSAARESGLSAALFQVRTRQVLSAIAAARNVWFFSGLLIGAELERITRGERLVLIGEPARLRLYDVARREPGGIEPTEKPTMLSLTDCVVAGQERLLARHEGVLQRMKPHFDPARFQSTPLIGIVRHADALDHRAFIDAVLAGGLTTLEVSFTHPDAAAHLAQLHAAAGGRLNLGAGTVTTIPRLEQALAAGASFIVTPVMATEALAACIAAGVPIFPGAFTPSEIVTAPAQAATMVKIFPAVTLGPAFVAQLKALIRRRRLSLGRSHSARLLSRKSRPPCPNFGSCRRVESPWRTSQNGGAPVRCARPRRRTFPGRTAGSTSMGGARHPHPRPCLRVADRRAHFFVMNTRPLVVITRRYPTDLLTPLAPFADVVMPEEERGAIGHDEVLRHGGRVAAIINQGELRIDAPLLAAAPALRIVANTAIGVNNFAQDHMRARSIWGTNTPQAFAEATADCTLGLLLMLVRRLGEGDRFVRAGRWKTFTPGLWDGVLLRGKTLGIVGYGRIGRAVELRAKAFGLTVVHHTRSGTDRPGWRSLEALLAASDFVSLHVPLTPQTRSLIDQVRLAQMKDGACLINLARGPVVDEAALIAALRSGRLAGAALDVFADEPTVPDELRAMENVVLTPHLGGGSREGRREAQKQCVENVLRVLRGEHPIDECIVVEPEAPARS